MSRKSKLINLLSKYDKEISLKKEENDSLVTIYGDIARTRFPFSENKSKEEIILTYQNILYEIFKDIPLKYFQGMTEIASVLVELYFEELVSKLEFETEDFENDSDESTKEAEMVPKEEKIVDKKYSFSFKNSNNDKILKEFLKLNSDKINSLQRIFYYFMLDKHTPLVENDFSLYKDYTKVFIKLMKAKGIKIDKNVSLTYMNVILLFFSREFENLDVACHLYSIIVQSDSSALFSMLAVLFEQVDSSSLTRSSGKLISKLPENFMEELKNTHIEFKRLYEIGDNENSGLWSFLAVGVAVSAAAVGVAVYYKSKK